MKRILESEAQEIRDLRAEGYQLKEIAEKTGRSITAIHRAIHKKQTTPRRIASKAKAIIDELPKKHRPMLALIGDRDEVTKTIKELFS